MSNNYANFERSIENRNVDTKKRRKLAESMREYGFLQCFPIVVKRNESGKLVIIDGQHRFFIASELNLPIYYVEENTEFDVAVVNSASRTWVPRDYADRFAAAGNEDYLIGVQFSETYKIPVGMAFALLGGTTTFSNIQSDFTSGRFKIRDREWAGKVATVYSSLAEMSKDVRNSRFLDACMAVCRLESFDPTRLIENARKCREKLVCYSRRDAYLDMIESIYNFNRKYMVALKIESIRVMRERNAAYQSVQSKKKRELTGTPSE